MTFTAIDCQSFAGGFAYGVVKAGFELIAKREQPGGFGVAAMEANRHLLGDKWQAEDGPAQSWTPLQADLVFGNPPCSGFSNMALSFGPEWRAEQNRCMFDLIEYAAKCNPQIVIFESVQNAYSKGRELMQELRQILAERTGNTWTLYHVLHNVKDLGGAQDRPRYFFVASRIPFGIDLTSLVPGQTVMQRIGDLVDVHASEIEGHTTLDAPRTKRIADLARGAVWKQGEHSGYAHERAPHISVDTCERAKKGGFAAIRLHENKPSRVIDGHSAERFVHPTEPRVLSFREIARLTGFPEEWKTDVYRFPKKRHAWFGKGICVEAGNWIAKAAHDALAGNPQSYKGEQIGQDEFLIDAQLKNVHKLPPQPLFRLEGDW